MNASLITAGGALRRLGTRALSAVEPWYNWGIVCVERMEGMRVVNGFPQSVAEGKVRFFELQWFGVHLQVQLGRTPKKEGC